MKLIRIASVACLLTLALQAPASAALVLDHRKPSTQGDVWDPLNAGYVTDILVSLKKNIPVAFSTGNTSPGGDPVLHLLGPGASTNGQVQEVARDDDSAGALHARITFTPPQDGDYRLILRAAADAYGGTCTLYQDNKPLLSNIPFGAAMREYDNLRKGETLTMVQMPNGLIDFPALYFFDDHGALVRRHLQIGGVVSFALDKSYPVLYAVAAKSVPLAPTGTIRVVRNDAPLSGHDSDKDGLGNELETWVGTCSSLTALAGGWDCSRSTDARDTDGDGISDADELLGRMDLNPPLWLPRWGATPLHKDIFIEVDYTLPTAVSPDSKMPPAVAKEMAAAYAETNVVPTPFDATLHAQRLNNPDGLPGVRLHLDTGVAPLAPADATIYGNWGGHSAVPPGTDASAGYITFMDPGRRGYFHYNNSYLGSGGQCPINDIACSWSQSDPQTAIHEFGHTLGLAHFGPEAGVHDANCKVSYPSAMNYAHPPAPYETFSDGYGRPVYDNAALQEVGAVPNPTLPRSQALLQRLYSQYGYMVDMATGNVDWNRDGAYQAGTIRAYSNSRAYGDCEFTSSNFMNQNSAVTLKTPAAARLLDQVFIFFLDSADHLQLLQSNPAPFNCPTNSEPGCGTTTFTSVPMTQPWMQGIASVAVQNQIENGVPLLLILFSDLSGNLKQIKLLQLSGGLPVFSPLLTVQTNQPVVGELSMTGAFDHAWLTYLDSTRHVVLRTRSNGGGWSTEQPIQLQTLPITTLQDITPLSSPTVYEAANGTLYGAFPQGPNGGLLLLKRDAASGLWNSDQLHSGTLGSSFGKAAMAWRAMPGAQLPGRLYVYWYPRVLISGQPDRGALMENWLTRNSANVVDMNFTMYHSNVWYTGHGVAALYDPAIDDDIRLVVPIKDNSPDTPAPDGALQVRPKADGLADVAQPDRDDWEAIGTGLCKNLVSQQTDPILCPN
jgi:hypothetical protein